MFSSICGCVNVCNQEGSGGVGRVTKHIFGDRGNGMEDHLKRNLHTIRGRRQLIRDTPIAIAPTTFDDDQDLPSEDEDGAETLVLKDGVFAGQQFELLRSHCLESGQLFVDPQFPPCDASLFLDKQGDAAAAGSSIEWKRPSDICSTPTFLLDSRGGSRFNVKQGDLGDCWLLAAIANLTLEPKLFAKVVPQEQGFQGDYAGIFHFRFWQYGTWVDVVVDDLLPTRDGGLIYTRSNISDEFWSALMEKAYAKLYGSYLSLRGGTASEAMVDFSGGCSEQYDLRKAPRDIYDILVKGYARGSMMACSIEPDPRVAEAKTNLGIVKGHAYSMTKVIRATVGTETKKEEFPLIRIRNPWGNDTEWKGAWSDGSREWKLIPEEEKETLGITFDADGEFYMSNRDFLKQFDTLEICHLSPDLMDEDDQRLHWHEKRFYGSWVEGKSAGGCINYMETFSTNPQFRVVLTDSDEDSDQFCTCVISLLQQGSRRKKAILGEGCLTIGYIVYKVDNPEETSFPLDSAFFSSHSSAAKPDAFTNLRETTARFKLNPGTYVVVPSTFEPNMDGDFLLRVFSESHSSVDCVTCEE